MKKLFITIACALIIVGVLSCNKATVNSSNCSGPTAVKDSGFLLSFAQKYGINPVHDTSWLYYEIINPGSGVAPVATSKVYVNYAGRFMDGTYFDSTTTSVHYELDSLIKGLQYGLVKIKTGGRIKLLIPSALAYGCQGVNGVVPANAPLYFDIRLDSLK
jgi:FKBP-type peptidyl-prolyl cis-trans isomerase FkpA